MDTWSLAQFCTRCFRCGQPLSEPGTEGPEGVTLVQLDQAHEDWQAVFVHRRCADGVAGEPTAAAGTRRQDHARPFSPRRREVTALR